MPYKHLSSILIAILLSSSLLGCSIAENRYKQIGISMEPTIGDGEIVRTIETKTLQHGDIVVFNPEGLKTEYYLKRIIGIPGDTVQLKSGSVFVNNMEIDEPYLPEGVKTCMIAVKQDCEEDDKGFTVPEESYFVLGDNRRGSSDSRSFYDKNNLPAPYVHRENILGKVQTQE